MSVLVSAGKFWLVVVMMILALYVSYFNRTFIPISLPPVVESMNLPAFVIYLAWLATGCAMTWFFLGIDLLKKSWQIRKLSKQVRELGGAGLDDGRKSKEKSDPYTRRNDISVY